MSYLALYRKYRPSNFDELVGQDKVVKVINSAIVNGRISHAYLFSGPRGTGKTTTAKIIAKMVNCKNIKNGMPCGICENCINFSVSNDIVEIDAASNNGVEEIRELRDKVNLVPTNSKYKVYIIDEVHMLTTQAFNALLKTLEEPPKHVIFILATTEPYKVPLTVSSRCQKFQFNKIDDEEIVKRLKQICLKEEILIKDDALYEIARLSDGGLRDAINLLDQLTAYKNDIITLDDVYKVNGSVSYKNLYQLLIDIKNGDRKNIIDLVNEFDRSGKNISKFIEEMLIFLKDVLIYKNSKQKTKIQEKNEILEEISKCFDDILIYFMINNLNELLNTIKVASYPSILLLVNLLKTIEFLENKENDKENTFHAAIEPSNSMDEKLERKEEKNISREIITKSENNIDYEKFKQIRINNSFSTASKTFLNDVKIKWSTIFDYVLDDDFKLAAGLLADTVPMVVGEQNMILVSKYDASAIRINNNLTIIEQLLNIIYEKNYSIIAISTKEWEEERNRYISNVKKGYKYNYVSEEKESTLNLLKIEKTAVDQLIDLVGEEMIEYK